MEYWPMVHMIQSVKWWKLITLLLIDVHRKRGINASLTVTPVDTNATLGSQVRLNCSTNAKTEVNWQYGEESMADVYIANEGMLRIYRKKHRYKVDVNSTIGQYDLVISNVTNEDSGMYVCSEPEGWTSPPRARLTITRGELPAKMHRENVFAAKGGELQISFPSCSPQPYYLTHIPVGLSHSNDVYNLGKLLNSYANSGRFTVDVASEGLKLRLTNIILSDAGTYTCRGDSGRGDRHNKELIVLEQRKDQPQEGASKNSTSNSSKTTAIVISVVSAGVIVAGIVVVVVWSVKHNRQSEVNQSAKEEGQRHDRKNGNPMIHQNQNQSSEEHDPSSYSLGLLSTRNDGSNDDR